MNKIIKVDDDDDGFGGSIANSRFIRGQILRWSDTGGWSDRDGLRPPEEPKGAVGGETEGDEGVAPPFRGREGARQRHGFPCRRFAATLCQG